MHRKYFRKTFSGISRDVIIKRVAEQDVDN